MATISKPTKHQNMSNIQVRSLLVKFILAIFNYLCVLRFVVLKNRSHHTAKPRRMSAIFFNWIFEFFSAFAYLLLFAKIHPRDYTKLSTSF
jgi:hypothetical protein